MWQFQSPGIWVRTMANLWESRLWSHISDSTVEEKWWLSLIDFDSLQMRRVQENCSGGQLTFTAETETLQRCAESALFLNLMSSSLFHFITRYKVLLRHISPKRLDFNLQGQFVLLSVGSKYRHMLHMSRHHPYQLKWDLMVWQALEHIICVWWKKIKYDFSYSINLSISSIYLPKGFMTRLSLSSFIMFLENTRTRAHSLTNAQNVSPCVSSFSPSQLTQTQHFSLYLPCPWEPELMSHLPLLLIHSLLSFLTRAWWIFLKAVMG